MDEWQAYRSLFGTLIGLWRTKVPYSSKRLVLLLWKRHMYVTCTSHRVLHEVGLDAGKLAGRTSTQIPSTTQAIYIQGTS